MKQAEFTLKIEVLTPEHWKEYQEIRLRALKTDPIAFGSSYEEEVVSTEEEIRKRLSAINRKIYGARVGNRIVSIAAYKIEIPKKVEHMATIVSVFTDPEFRNKGISTELLKKILDDLYANPKITKVRLSVNEVQQVAKKMYEKMGFIQIGILKKEVKVAGTYYNQAQMELIFEDKI